MLGGLVLAMGGSTSGLIIWVGTIVSYLIAGIITREVADIPVQMSYGGWKVNRRRKK